MKFQITRSVVVIAAIFILGYVFVIYSVIFSKSTSYSEIIKDELEYGNEFLHKQLDEKKQEIAKLKGKLEELKGKDVAAEKALPVSTAYRPGVIVLGMHRSGTSILGGLVNKMGLKTGGHLIPPAEDNAKGFFERIDVVLQNDKLLHRQGIDYSMNTFRYDALKGLKDILNGMDGDFFSDGREGLEFLNEPQNYPWMLKDPRLCITFRTWIPLLNFVPAILFTYRHPFDVAISMNTRYEHFKIARTLKLWYVYNRRAIEQSHDLCRVVTSHRMIMQHSSEELRKVRNELIACGVDVPHEADAKDIATFIDIRLQHGKTTLKDSSCEGDTSTLMPPSTWPTTEQEHISLYREVMRVYCAMENGSAFKKSFSWDASIKDM